MVTLLILDGYGYSKERFGNAIWGNDKFFKKLENEFPSCLLSTSGEEVGLAKGQMGNSETGHLNIGAGRIVYQDLTRIDKAIKTGQIKENETIKNAIEHAKKYKSKVHLIGLLSDGGVHSTIKHLKELVKIFNDSGIEVVIHAFLDGRDTPVDSGKKYLKDMQEFLDEKVGENKRGQIVSLAGRVWGMDREKRFDRVKRVYDMFVGNKGEYKSVTNLSSEIDKSYANKVFDEYFEPTILKEAPVIQENDVVVSFNFRTDRMRELISAISQKDFNEFKTKEFNNIFVATMTEYDKSFKNVNLIFEPEKIDNCLSEILSKNGKTQFRIAETTKYAHVTFFFNGGEEIAYPGEERLLIDSINTTDYSTYPKMRAGQITKKTISAMKSRKYDFILVNLSNPDMIGHTGNFKKTQQAIKYIDKCLNKIAKVSLWTNSTLLVTADHGNAERMIDIKGNRITSHTTNPVPFILVSHKYKDIKLKNGNLASIAPTILKILNIKKPSEFTGKPLF